ncbi:hypothetical protein DFH09DRAFT_1076601 [Mycena vulgaris]|nr:hypothetical protein DFH09DRAFT_1076601 [Mycena vulgaris]
MYYSMSRSQESATPTKTLLEFWVVHASNTGTGAGMPGDVAAKVAQLEFADARIVALADLPLTDVKQTAEDAKESRCKHPTILGGNRILEKGSREANVDQTGEFTAWITRLWAVTTANFGVDVDGKSQH